MYHSTSKWQRGPLPPGCLRMAHRSSADGPTSARRVPMDETVQKTVEDPVEIQQVQILDRVVDLPVVLQRQVPMVLTVLKPVEIPQIQIVGKVVGIPVVVQ